MAKQELQPQRSGDRTGRRFKSYYRNLISIRKKYIQGFKPEVWSDSDRHIIMLDYRETGVKVIMSLSSDEHRVDIRTGGLVIMDTEDENAMVSGSGRRIENTTLNMHPYSAIIVRYSH